MLNAEEINEIETAYNDLMDLPVSFKYRARMRDALGIIKGVLTKNGHRVEARRAVRATGPHRPRGLG